MLRNDFVSNSSSSSFIVLKSENKFNVLLGETEPREMTLKQYLTDFYNHEFVHYHFSGDKRKTVDCLHFVNDIRFSKDFGLPGYESGHDLTFPEGVKDLVTLYYKKSDDLYYNCDKLTDSQKEKVYSAQDRLKTKIINGIYKILKNDWDKETFCYSEIDDSWIPDLDTDAVEYTRDRIEYINSLKPIRFLRVFDNH